MNLKELILFPLIMMSTFEGSYGFFSDEVVITGKRGSYQAALDHCKSQGQKLIRVKNEGDNTLLTSLAVAKGVGRFWVDGNDIKVEGTWVNSYNKPLEYKKWHAGEPNNFGGNEDCAEIFYFGNSDWNDIDCATNNGIICFHDRRCRTRHNLLSPEYVSVTGRRGSFQAAQDHCKSIGLRIVRVENEEDNTLLNTLAVGKSIGRFWVDGNDIKVEGTWVDSDHNKLTYKKWHAGEPNNFGGNEDCAEIFFFGNSDWNDIDCATNNGIICFHDRRCRTRHNLLSHEYVSVTGRRGSFQAAKDHCKSIGLRLVRVENEEDNTLLNTLAVGKSIGRFWVDGNDIKVEGTWVDSDNKKLTYKKWHAGEPNNAGNEDCAEIFFFGNSDWNDIDCATNNGIICYYDICR